MSIEAMKQAIDALNEAVAFREGGRQKAIDAITALRTAIQQGESEPVAWRYQPDDGLKFPGFTQYEAVAVSRGKLGTVTPLYTHSDPDVPDDVVRNAERYRWLMSWLQQMNLLKAEFGQMGKGEKPSDWWMLNAPYGIDKTRPFFGHGKTADAAIDAAMLSAAQAQKGQP